MKVKLTVDLLRENNTSVLNATTPSGTITKTAATHSEAKALVQAELDARLANANGVAQDLSDANSAFNA